MEVLRLKQFVFMTQYPAAWTVHVESRTSAEVKYSKALVGPERCCWSSDMSELMVSLLQLILLFSS